METDKHLTFVFIFVLTVFALIIGEVNNQALNEREKNNEQKTTKRVLLHLQTHDK